LKATAEQSVRRKWYSVNLSTTNDAREAVEYALMEAGALGTQAQESKGELLHITAYFEVIPDLGYVKNELFEALRIYSLPSSVLGDLAIEELAYRDWLVEWKKSWQPVEVGRRFIIAPSWSEIPDAGDRIVIRIEPGMAFGTGTHETTRLCLTALEKHFEGESFLDVGTGTGILAIAAAKLFPTARVVACDTDADAVLIARENGRLNGVDVSFNEGTIDESFPASADCVCANLTLSTILPLLPALIGASCRRLILSGLLDSQIEPVVTRLQELAMSEPAEIMEEGEWVCLVI
jgi:ribosomal protein L11 methyltransferase